MRNAFLAGTPVALACGLIGYFVVLRSQVFAGDALSHVACTGALGRLRPGSTSGLASSRRRSPSRGGWGCSASAPGPTTS